MEKNKKKKFSRQNLTAMMFRILWHPELVSVTAFFAFPSNGNRFPVGREFVFGSDSYEGI